MVQCPGQFHIQLPDVFSGDLSETMSGFGAVLSLGVPHRLWEFPTGEVMHHFRFNVIKLWEIPAETFKQTGLIGLLPLMVLSQDGKRQEVVEEIISNLETTKEKSSTELLSLTYVLASLTFENEDDHAWLKRRFNMARDILRDTWAYQEIMHEGLEEERKQRLKDQRQMLMALAQAHFPRLLSLAEKQAEAIEEPDVLQRLLLKLLAIQAEEEAQEALLSVEPGKKKAGAKKKKKA